MASGLAFFISESQQFGQKFSAAADDLGPATLDIVSAALDKAKSRAEGIVMSGGINGTKKGGPRIKSRDMIGSLDGTSKINGRARVQGEFGFINGAPKWTLYQEKGTTSGSQIPAMLAFATANNELVDELQSQFEQGDWLNLNL